VVNATDGTTASRFRRRSRSATAWRKPGCAYSKQLLKPAAGGAVQGAQQDHRMIIIVHSLSVSLTPHH